MPPALRKRPVSPASAAATLACPTYLPTTVAPQHSADAHRKTAVSR
ncbi:hypothetical protein [Streptomyces viridochromogenes]|nr:hypothetical protein [Streptomyces viridochromogenes]